MKIARVSPLSPSISYVLTCQDLGYLTSLLSRDAGYIHRLIGSCFSHVAHIPRAASSSELTLK